MMAPIGTVYGFGFVSSLQGCIEDNNDKRGQVKETEGTSSKLCAHSKLFANSHYIRFIRFAGLSI